MSIAIPELETVYDALAQAIDAVDPAKRELFLVKLEPLLFIQLKQQYF